MFYKYRKGINLSGSDVEVNYTRYINNYKKDLQLNDKTIGEAVEAGKKKKNLKKIYSLLVGIAKVNESQQAVILDTIDDGKFVFENKQIKMTVNAERTPNEFFYIHINYKPSR